MKNISKILLITLSCYLTACSKKDDPSAGFSVKSIAPLTAGYGDTVTISGDNLTSAATPVITVNGKTLTIVQSSKNVVKVVIPRRLGSGVVKVVAGSASYDGPNFYYKYKATVTTIAGTESSFYCPWGITADANGDLYIADTYARLIRKISAATKQVSTISIPTYIGAGGNFYSPYNIAVDPKTHNIYVTDFNRHMMRIDAANQMSLIYDADHTTTATGVAVGPDGKIYISNNSEGTILQFDPANGFSSREFTTGLINPRNIIFDTNGKMYVAAYSTSLGSVIVNIDNTGKATVAKSDLSFKGWEIAVDKDGNFYEADHFSNSLRMIEPNGIITVIAGSGEAADVDGIGLKASFNGPQGITIDGDGNLYITTFNYDTNGGNKVRKVAID